MTKQPAAESCKIGGVVRNGSTRLADDTEASPSAKTNLNTTPYAHEERVNGRDLPQNRFWADLCIPDDGNKKNEERAS